MSAKKEAAEALGRLIGEAGEKAARAAGGIGEGAMKVARDKMAKVSDWGWKGGKPGEVTGDMYVQAQKALDLAPKGKTREAKKVLRDIDAKFAKQLGYGNMERLFPPGRSANSAAGDRFNIAREFSDMQRADIPREWTGKISKALQRRSSVTDTAMLPYASYPTATRYASLPGYKSISEAMREMNNDQRETFLALWPAWEGSLAELAQTAKQL